MTLYRSDQMGGMPTQISEFDNRSFVKKSQLACIHELKKRVQANKGVKTYNVLSMFVPLGLDETAVEEQLFIDLNTFGARRGDVAHRGLHAIMTLPDPKEDKILSERIISSLENFEAHLATATL
ncbi:hypothetical protein [Sphingomonas sp. OTU376]|uniref:hypothetical protein n=1 Tax=Sphingomonas sp. OTU376 TaxID=3043863 RepID=UPI00313CE609